ncbi:aspartyl-phosphate phosphatase Spo0E family protein [Halobacillus amylolyticus]|uniref:Aspartyl-phosphate phosphatase Spo0E family protein n=1 Tax=Halobacillus amylolyticus TaxID=2932259 RepID=A0ABY4H6R6_9BACI|nr:aspartyl-phosphate phosphatase Spo0E family protein [Halobacillus amylolyticus]UOR10568.1 aspartyl-phosphate phosphatase Spo0E family protein [Halobacillus amylolyticus]
MGYEVKLLEEIEACRKEMSRLACENSLTSESVIRISVKLDCLLNEFENIKQKQLTPQEVSCS